MELYEFFGKYKIVEQDRPQSACVGCQVERQECGQFPGCPLPLGYIFTKKKRRTRKNEGRG